MRAYLLFTHEKTLDKGELLTYSIEAPATLAGHEVKVLAFSGISVGFLKPFAFSEIHEILSN
jgi:hypothetical protein